MPDDDLIKELENAFTEIQDLKSRLNELESLSGKYKKLPDTMILSESFITRAFAVFGHNFLIGMMISIPFWFLALIIAVVSGTF